MSEKTLMIIPTLEDLLGAAVAAAAGSFQGKSPSRCAIEQLASKMTAKNLANYVDFTNDMTSTATPLPIAEDDMLTGVVRGGYSMYKGRSGKENVMDGLGGILASVMGKEVKKSFFGSTTA